MLDVTIALAVIGVLVVLMLPAIGLVRETARRVHCGSNLRQLGLGVQMYANINDDRIPATTSLDQSIGIRGEAKSPLIDPMRLRFSKQDARRSKGWTALGRLFGARIIEAPAVTYCPSHTGEFTLESYATAWKSGEGELAGNFYLRDRSAPRRFSDAPSRTAIAIDGFPEEGAFNHEAGTNVLRADISVTWRGDPSGDLATSLSPARLLSTNGEEPKDGGHGGATTPNDPWRTLDFFGVAGRGD